MKSIKPLDSSIDIILTPQFYRFIREELDFKFTYQAKQIAGSLFDDYLEDSDEYQYYVYKDDNTWCFFAYNINKIGTFLESVGIDKSRISKIYFIQQLIGQIEIPTLIDDRTLLANIDNTMTIVPREVVDNSIEYNFIDISSVKLKGGVTMGSSLNSYLSLKETILLSSIFCILGGISLFEADRVKKSIEDDSVKLTELLDENPQYASSLVRQSILSKYKPIDKIERLKRESIKDISKLLSNKSRLKKLNIDKKGVDATIKTDNKKLSREIEKSAKNKNFRVSTSSLNVKVEKKI